MLKSIIHKLDKFRIKNENELISQLKKLYNDADEFDLDLTGKYYKSQPYDKMPTPEIVNWCSWNYNKSFLFEKKTEDDKKESTVEVVTSNENKDEEKGKKNPTSPIRLLYLDNKIETFFGYPGTLESITSLLSSYDKNREILFLYKLLLIISNLDITLLLPSLNSENYIYPLSSLYTKLKEI